MLATSADRRVAEAVAAHLGLFDAVHASDGLQELSGARREARLREALGEILAEDVTAPIPVPHYASSAMDGYAVAGPQPWTVVFPEPVETDPRKMLTIPPKELYRPVLNLEPGQATRIVTGGLVRLTGSGLGCPTKTVTAESPCQPSTMAPQSMETRSPSASSRGPGMPCTTSSLTEMQVTPGKPPRPLTEP